MESAPPSAPPGGRCPLCRDNTKTVDGGERCVRPDCTAHHITRNTRGEAWVRDRDGRLVSQPYPNSVAHTRDDGPRRVAGWADQVLAADHDITPYGRIELRRRDREDAA